MSFFELGAATRNEEDETRREAPHLPLRSLLRNRHHLPRYTSLLGESSWAYPSRSPGCESSSFPVSLPLTIADPSVPFLLRRATSPQSSTPSSPYLYLEPLISPQPSSRIPSSPLPPRPPRPATTSQRPRSLLPLLDSPRLSDPSVPFSSREFPLPSSPPTPRMDLPSTKLEQEDSVKPRRSLKGRVDGGHPSRSSVQPSPRCSRGSRGSRTSYPCKRDELIRISKEVSDRRA